MQKITLECAKRIIKRDRDQTNFFNETLYINSFYEKLKDAEFQDAEVNVIIAALRLIGAKFMYDE